VGASGQPLRSGHGNSPHAIRVQMRPDFNQDLCLVAGSKEVIDWRQAVIEADVDYTAANRKDGPAIL
jgi:hypothetical protein